MHESESSTITTKTTTYTMKTPSLIPLKERRPRVIVEISRNDVKTPNEHTGAAVKNDKLAISPRSLAHQQHKTWEKKIEIMNSSTLVFQMKSNPPENVYSRTLNFDCVADGDADQLLRWQMSALVDRLLVDGRNNCCLLRIGPQRNAPTLHILSHTIIPEISKRLTSTNMSPLLLYAIRIEYYDVRKYDVVNMVLRAAPKNKPRHHITLRNTWELLQWVQDIYPGLWAQGAGHECLDLKFIFVRDQSGTKMRLKLSIVHFFLNKMDADMAAGLRNFLENSGASNNSRIKHSILTDYLREYFFSPDNWYIWMLFEVPGNNKGDVVNEMLTFASSAYAGTQSLIDGKIKTDISIFKECDLESDFICPIINSSQSPAASIRNAASTSAAQIAARFQKKEKQSLSYWYRQMDEKFLNVLLTMEAFYLRKYKPNSPESGSDGKYQTRIRDRREFVSTVRNPPKSGPQNDIGLKALASSYKTAVLSLHSLIQQVERSPFARLLRVLIQMKNNEIVQHFTNLRDRVNAPLTKDKRSSKSETPRNAISKTKAH